MKKTALWICLTVAGLAFVALASRNLAFRSRNFNASQAQLDSDCDQCVLVETLEVLPFVVATCAVYLLSVAVIWWWLRNRGRSA